MPAAPTSFLYLSSLHCLQQRDLPFDGDSPYLLLFAGQPGAQPQADLIRITHTAWQDGIRSGSLQRPETWVHHDLRRESVLLVALLEQNWQLDIHDEALCAIRETMVKRWAHCVRRLPTSNLPLAARLAFAGQLQRHLRNDALIQLRQLSVTTLHGKLPPLSFTGRRARYRVGFRAKQILPA